ISGVLDGVRLINLYVPNGSSIGSEKYDYKLRWLDALHEAVRTEAERHARLVLLGDFNIAPADEDVHDPERWQGSVLVSDAERERYRRIVAAGFTDVFRLFDQPPATFSWWDYRAAGFRRNAGLRIDLILATDALARRCCACTIDNNPRALERPSDHAPVLAQFRGAD
ncbi:MAG: exodeoxyribonuclease III, partial [Pseudomonadota bacterium]